MISTKRKTQNQTMTWNPLFSLFNWNDTIHKNFVFLDNFEELELNSELSNNWKSYKSSLPQEKKSSWLDFGKDLEIFIMQNQQSHHLPMNSYAWWPIVTLQFAFWITNANISNEVEIEDGWKFVIISKVKNMTNIHRVLLLWTVKFSLICLLSRHDSPILSNEIYCITFSK